MHVFRLSLAVLAVFLAIASFFAATPQSGMIMETFSGMTVMTWIALTLPNHHRFLYFGAGVTLMIQLFMLALSFGIVKFVR
jgi:hypothetical protein